MSELIYKIASRIYQIIRFLDICYLKTWPVLKMEMTAAKKLMQTEPLAKSHMIFAYYLNMLDNLCAPQTQPR